MSSKSLAILVGILSLLWFWFCWHWQCCWIRGACCEKVAATMPIEPTASAAEDRGPLVFQWDNPEAFTNDKFPSYKSSILKDRTDDNNLVITGQYYQNETNTTSYENMGIARAAAVREILAKDVPPERVRLASQLMSGAISDTSSYFPAVDFRWEAAKTKESEVIQLADRTVILFPYNSTQKEADANVEEYLNKLAERVKSSGESIVLTGHADSDGNESYNNQLGLKRANVIRDLLVRKGIKSSQIKVLSKGETQPVASNETDAGKRQNRRVEVQLEKN